MILTCESGSLIQPISAGMRSGERERSNSATAL